MAAQMAMYISPCLAPKNTAPKTMAVVTMCIERNSTVSQRRALECSFWLEVGWEVVSLVMASENPVSVCGSRKWLYNNCMESAVQVKSDGAASTKESKIFEPPKGFESKFSGMALDLPIFEGPLDLLLFLIRDQKLDIMDLPIAHVTKQYMDYLFRMEEFKLEIAAEFISMAAQLVQIKSRMLLPLTPKDGEAEDPREELALRLQQYEAIKEAAKELSIREGQMHGVIFTSGLDMDEYAKTEDEPIRATAMDLLSAYRDILKHLLPPPPVEVMAPPKTLEQRIAEVLEMLGSGNWLPFARLFAESRNREDLILTFLALLEIVKNGRAKLVQTEIFGEIRVQAA